MQITGGAGFVGSHLTDKLMMDGHEVTVVDNFFTGRKRNVEHWIGHENFELINHDVVEPLYIEGERDVHCYHSARLVGAPEQPALIVSLLTWAQYIGVVSVKWVLFASRALS